MQEHPEYISAVNPHHMVSDRKTIMWWVSNFTLFRETGSAQKRESRLQEHGLFGVRTQENVTAVRKSFLQSRTRYTMRSKTFGCLAGLTEKSVRRVLHSDLKLHPYTMMVVNEIKQPDVRKGLQIARPFLKCPRTCPVAYYILLYYCSLSNGYIN